MANFYPPSVRGIDREVELNKSISASLLFDYTDLDGNPMEKVRFFDSNGAGDSGFFTYNGREQNAGQWFEVDVADLHKVRYNAGLVVTNEVVNILAYDGEFWSESTTARVFSVKPNVFRPKVTALAATVLSDENIMARDMFEATDADGDEITRYRLRDQKSNGNSGAFYLNNVKQVQGRWFEFSAEELNKVRYYGGRNGQAERFFVQAYDGSKWSTADFEFVRTTPNRHRPVVTAVDRELKTQSVVNVGNLFSWTDRDGNTLKKYAFFDTGILPDGGFFSVNNIRQNSREWFEVNARDVEQNLVRYHSAQVPDSERLRVKVYDGRRWSTVRTFRVDSVSTPDVDAPVKVELLNDSTEIAVTDWAVQTDTGPEIVKWQLFDATSVLDDFGNEISGNLTVDGNALAPQRIREFNAADLADVTFKSGVADRGIEHDEVYLRGFNGSKWSTWERVNVTSLFNVPRALMFAGLPGNPNYIGGKWGSSEFGTGTTLTYSFMDGRPPSWLGCPQWDAWQFIPDTLRQATRDILKDISQVVDITFVEVSDTVPSHMNFGMWSAGNPGLYAEARFPGPDDPACGTISRYGFDGVESRAGDMWINSDFVFDGTDENGNDVEYTWLSPGAHLKGSVFYETIIHEIGHALGLHHNFNQGDWDNNTRDFVDRVAWTTMSYNEPYELDQNMSGRRPVITPLEGGAASTQLLDILTYETLYGLNMEYNKEDTYYRYSPNEHKVYSETIHDPGGIDTLDFSNYTGRLSQQDLADLETFYGETQIPAGSVIDLREGHHSSIGGAARNFAIAWGTLIENVKGTSSADYIIGNEADNRIIGGFGNDIISTKGGRDVAIGGPGRDTYIYELGDGRLTIDEDKGGGIDALEFHSFHENFDSFTQDLSFRKINGRHLQVSLTMNGEKSEGTATIRNMNWGGSKVETLRLFDNKGDQIGEDISLKSIFLQATNNLQRFERTEFQDQFGYLAIPS